MQTFEEIEPTVFVLVWLFFKAMSFKWKVMSLCFLNKEIVRQLLSSIQYINNQQLFILKLTNNFSYWSWDKAHHTIKSHRGKSPCRHLDLKKFRFLEHSINFCPTFRLGSWDFKTPTLGRWKTKTNSFQNPNVIKHTVHERKKKMRKGCASQVFQDLYHDYLRLTSQPLSPWILIVDSSWNLLKICV